MLGSGHCLRGELDHPSRLQSIGLAVAHCVDKVNKLPSYLGQRPDRGRLLRIGCHRQTFRRAHTL